MIIVDLLLDIYNKSDKNIYRYRYINGLKNYLYIFCTMCSISTVSDLYQAYPYYEQLF